MQVLSFKNMNTEQIEDLARIHIRSIPYSINAKMGMQHLQALYSSFQKSSDIFGYFALEQGKPCGLVLASLDCAKSAQAAEKARSRILLRLTSVRFLLSSIHNILDFLSVNVVIRRRYPNAAYLMIWFVDSDRSNMGIGKLLLESLDKELVDRNIETTVVDVRKTSLGAIRGYQRNGFEIRNKTLLSLVLFKENF